MGATGRLTLSNTAKTRARAVAFCTGSALMLLGALLVVGSFVDAWIISRPEMSLDELVTEWHRWTILGAYGFALGIVVMLFLTFTLE